MFDDDASVFQAMRAGARGYLLKGAGEQEIERAVRGVADGEAIFGPAVAQRVLATLQLAAVIVSALLVLTWMVRGHKGRLPAGAREPGRMRLRMRLADRED